jgi:hypothetical protein
VFCKRDRAARGAWPTSCYPLYPVGGRELLRYTEACAEGRFADYLADFLRWGEEGAAF